MAKFFDNVTGWQKVLLILGGVVLLIGARALFPEEAQWVRTWVGDLVSAGMTLIQGGG